MKVDFEILQRKVWASYKNARQHKRNTVSQLRFEINQEENLLLLAEALHNRTYQPARSIAFIVFKPVKREIFAADFRDRVVHHLLVNAIMPLVEARLYYDAYSCRKQKGTLFGIQRVEGFIRSCTQNYTKEAWAMKLDISGFFMNIVHQELYNKMQAVLGNILMPGGLDRALIDFLLQRTIFLEPAKHCYIKGNKKDWEGIPADKSLFTRLPGVGLPIGNLTSQVFSNLYLNDLDHFINHQLGITYYGRYVDDMVLIHNDKDCLLQARNKIAAYLENLGLLLHPRKNHLQPVTNGLPFLGQFLLPWRRYAGTRLKRNAYTAVYRINKELATMPVPDMLILDGYRATINAYLGILAQAKTLHLRIALLSALSPIFYNFFYVSPTYTMVAGTYRFKEAQIKKYLLKTMALYSDLPVYKICYDFLLEIFKRTAKLDREYKFTVGEKLKSLSLELVLAIYRANKTATALRGVHLDAAREHTEELRIIMRVLHDLGVWSTGSAVHCSTMLESISKQLAAWQKYSGQQIGSELP